MFGQALTKYIIGLPSTSTTIGCPSWPRSVPVDCDQTIFSLLTLPALISFSGLWRVRDRSRPGAGQRSAFFAEVAISSLPANRFALSPRAAAPTTAASAADFDNCCANRMNVLLPDGVLCIFIQESPPKATTHLSECFPHPRPCRTSAKRRRFLTLAEIAELPLCDLLHIGRVLTRIHGILSRNIRNNFPRVRDRRGTQ